MNDKHISQAVIKRLPRYYRYLGVLQEKNVERISSGELSNLMNVTASQIRQDLNNFGGFGQQGYGYNVNYLYDEIGRILGLDRMHNIVIIGAGNMCHALVHYKALEKRGFKFVGVFDNNPELDGKEIGDLKVMMMDKLSDFVVENNVEIGTIAVPKQFAQEVCDYIIASGIRAIWNFAHTDLKVPSDAVVENVHLSESLMKLSYNYFNNTADTKFYI